MLFLFHFHTGEKEDRAESCGKSDRADRKRESLRDSGKNLGDRAEKETQNDKVGRMWVRCHGAFQCSCDEDDPQYQSDPQREKEGKVESADSVHGPVIQAQEQQKI